MLGRENDCQDDEHNSGHPLSVSSVPAPEPLTKHEPDGGKEDGADGDRRKQRWKRPK